MLRVFCIWLSIGLSLGLSIPAWAQVVRDGSIGPAAPLAVGSGLDPNGDFADYLIAPEQGEISGANLFHSFETFSLVEGEVATFTGPAGIARVVSRVTGASGTFINGTLRSTLPDAELFLLSPAGLVIGEGAQLDVPGSLHASTAAVLRFGDDPLLDLPADSLARPALLAAAPPSAFGFGPDPAGISIGVVDPSDPARALRIAPGETLSFIGGDVVLTGVPNSAPFFFQGKVVEAPGATVALASTAGGQEVPLAQVAGRTRLDLDALPADALTGDVLLQLNARIDVGAAAGSQGAAGALLVRAGNFRISDGRIEATHRSDAVDAGAFDIGTRDSIELAGARLTSSTDAAARGPDIRLASDEISIRGGSLIRVLSTGAGDSGDFSASGRAISILEEAELSSINTGAGAGGGVRLSARGEGGAGRLEIRGEATTPGGARLPSGVLSNPRGEGRGGAILLEADTALFANGAEALSISRGTASAAGGAIEIRAAQLSVESGSFVSATTEGEAAGGAVTIEGVAGGRVDLVRLRNLGGEPQPARISTNTLSSADGAGRGGELALRAERLELTDGGQIFARTEGAGDAGGVAIDASSISIAGVLANPDAPEDPFRAGITSRVGTDGARGNGNLLSIETGSLEIENGGQVSSATFGIGDAGDLLIDSAGLVRIRGGAAGASRVSASAVAGPGAPGGGRGGLVTIEAARLELLEGGQVTAATVGAGDPGEVGDAGDVVVRAGSAEISGAAEFDASGIFSSSNSDALAGVGDGGNVTLEIGGDVTLADRGRIEVSSAGDGNAGNVLLTLGGSLRAEGGARIRSSTDDLSRGRAGSVDVVAEGAVLLQAGGEISASTGAESTGAGGRVAVRAGGDVRLREGSVIRSRSDGVGDAGDIEIAGRRFLGSGGSAISAQADEASGGSIEVTVDRRFELVDADAVTSVRGRVDTSDAGNLTIRTPGLVVVNRGALVAQAVDGAGGRIEVFSSGSFISGESLISASSQRGPQGEIELTPPENALISEIATLPAALTDASQLLARACDVRTEREGSFTVRPSAPAAAPPDASLPAALVTPTAPGPDCE